MLQFDHAGIFATAARKPFIICHPSQNWSQEYMLYVGWLTTSWQPSRRYLPPPAVALYEGCRAENHPGPLWDYLCEQIPELLTLSEERDMGLPAPSEQQVLA